MISLDLATRASVIGAIIALLAFLFGSDLGSRVLARARESRRARRARDRQLLAYLRSASAFFDGLEFFIAETWAWGPSVPNYSAAGSFPDPHTPLGDHGLALAVTVREGVGLYSEHSQRGGAGFPSRDQAIAAVRSLRATFWRDASEFARAEWPLRWRQIMKDMRANTVPNAERGRIARLKRERSSSSPPPPRAG